MVQVGEKYGKLTVLERIYNKDVKSRNNDYYMVRCDCGNKFLLRRDYIPTRNCCPQCKGHVHKQTDQKRPTLRQDLMVAISNEDKAIQEAIIFWIIQELLVDILKYCKNNNVSFLMSAIRSTMDKKRE